LGVEDSNADGKGLKKLFNGVGDQRPGFEGHGVRRAEREGEVLRRRLTRKLR